jgi:ribosome biogenesis protein SSF1/2
VIINGFGKGSEKEEAEAILPFQERSIVKTMFNNLFPGLDPVRSNPKNVKRCVLIDYNKKLDIIEFRHFYVKQNFTGINNKLKKIVNNNKIPNLGNCNDLAEYFTGNAGFVSDSDVDHLPNAHIDVETIAGDQMKKQQVKLRLYEIGPRITMQLMKIEEGFLNGPVFYHKFNKLSKEEERAKTNEFKEKEAQKLQRKEFQ